MSLARGLNILIPSSQNVSNHVHGTCFSAKKPVTAAREGVPAFVRVTPRDIFEVCQFLALFVATDPDTFWVEVRRSVCGEAKWYFDLKLDHLYPCLWRENILYFILFLYFYFKGKAGCLWPRLWRGKKKYFWHVCGHKNIYFWPDVRTSAVSVATKLWYFWREVGTSSAMLVARKNWCFR